MPILKPYPQLTEEQRKLIDFCVNTENNTFIEGPPWSGKSLFCLHSLQKIVAKKDCSALFMVSNNAMYGYMSIALKELGIYDNVSIETKDKFFWKLAGDYNIDINVEASYFENYDKILNCLLEIDLEKKHCLTIISEVQDYQKKEWELMQRVSQRIICYGDFKQGVYENNLERTDLIKDCVHHQLDYSFNDVSTQKLKNVRNYFFKNKEYVETIVANYSSATRDNGAYSMHLRYKTVDVKYENELQAIANRIKAFEGVNSRIAIICPDNTRFEDLSVFLENRAIKHNYYSINRELRGHDFTATVPMFISVFNAAGMQFDNVILFGFDESNYLIEMKRKENRLRNLLYVGMTRARKTTYIIRNEDTVKELKQFMAEEG